MQKLNILVRSTFIDLGKGINIFLDSYVKS